MILFCNIAIGQTTYYVSTTGNDSNSGDVSTPFQTIQYAISQSTNGDVIKVNPGIYEELLYLDGTNGSIKLESVSGPESTILSMPIGAVTLITLIDNTSAVSSKFEINGFTLKNTLTSSPSKQAFEFYRTEAVVKNVIVNNFQLVILMNTSSLDVQNGVFYNNVRLIENNNSFIPNPKISISQSTVVDVSDLLIKSNNSLMSYDIKNSIIVRSQNNSTYYFETIKKPILTNVFVDMLLPTVDSNSIFTVVNNAQSINFVDLVNKNFKLSNESSAIGSGAITPDLPLLDLDGNARPFPVDSNPDLGAYENAFATPQHNSTIYVAKTGNNSGSVGLSTAPFATIQAAIDYSINGDTVIVNPGTYIENVIYNGKNVTVTSLYSSTLDESYIASTIIDGGANGFPVVTLHNRESNNAKLIGFTIQNGLTATNEWGAGIDTNTASPELKYLVIKNNICTNGWPKTGGIHVVNAPSPVLIQNVEIKDNLGGAIYSLTGKTGSLKILNCKIHNNTTTTAASAIFIHSEQDSALPIENTLIYNNTFIGGNVIKGSNVVLLNSTLCSNNGVIDMSGNSGIINSVLGANHPINNQGILKVLNSLIQDGQSSIINPIPSFLTYTNTISGSPIFANALQNDFHLSNYSPAIGIGATTISAYNITFNSPSTDLEGNIRPNPINSNPDIGAYENTLAANLHNSIIYVAKTGSDSGSVGLSVAPFATIQAAIDYSINGDTVIVNPGTYTENIIYGGKNITVSSLYSTTQNEADITNTIIDGGGFSVNRNSVIRFVNNETKEAKIIGFTIQNGNCTNFSYPNNSGGGIKCLNSSPSILNCIIKNNIVQYSGGGIFVGSNSFPIINNCNIYNNKSESYGGGIAVFPSCSITINNSKIEYNRSLYGNGIAFNGQTSSTLTNSIISNNIGGYGGIFQHEGFLNINNCTITKNDIGVYLYWNALCNIKNTILYDNLVGEVQFDNQLDFSTVNISYSLIRLNHIVGTNGVLNSGLGVFDEQPSFVNSTLNNFNLQNTSPAIGSGTLLGFPLEDIEGNLRPNPIGSNPDMGAYENVLGTPSNNPPTLDQVSEVNINESAPQQSLNLLGISDGDYHATQNITITATSNNTALIPDPTVIYSLNDTTGTLQFTPVAGGSGTAIITITVQDNGGVLNGGINTTVKTFTVNVAYVNKAPISNSQAVVTVEDTNIAITLTGSDIEGSALNYSITTLPTSGVLYQTTDGTTLDAPITTVPTTVSNANKMVIYKPSLNQNGLNRGDFQFGTNDGLLNSVMAATVSVDVTAVNDAPLSTPQTVTTNEDTDLVITLSGTDVENSSLSFYINTLPTKGLLYQTLDGITKTDVITATNTMVTNVDGKIIFEPALNGNGNNYSDFNFKSNDGQTDGLQSLITVNVTAANDTPMANTQALVTLEDTNVAITLTGSDIEGSTLSYSITTLPASGVLYQTPDGTSLGSPITTVPTIVSNTNKTVIYKPSLNQNGLNRGDFQFGTNDGLLNSVTPATVSVDVTAVNDTPLSILQTVTPNEDTNLVITLSGSDVENSSLSFYINTLPTNGLLYQTLDGITKTDAITTTNTLVTNVDGKIIFEPALNGNGNNYGDFNFKLNDGQIDSLPSIITVNVTAVNDAPLSISQTVTTNEDTDLVIILSGTDVENSSLSFYINTLPANGVLYQTLDGITKTDAITATNTLVTNVDGKIIFEPALNGNGDNYGNFNFKLNDGQIDSLPSKITVNVTVVNDAPIANSQVVVIPEDTNIAITLTGSDIEGSTLNYSITTLPANGILYQTLDGITKTNAITATNTLVTNVDGKIIFELALNGNGDNYGNFNFKSNDGQIDSLPSTITVNVTAVNDLPTGIIISGNSIPENLNNQIIGNLSTTDVDLTDTFTYELVSGTGDTDNSLFSISGNQLKNNVAFDFEIQSAYSVRIKSTDGGSTSTETILSITVTNVNDITIASDVKNTYCDGDNASGTINITVIQTNGIVSYLWAGPNGFSSTQEDISNLSQGTYTVTVTDSNYSKSQEIVVGSTPIYSGLDLCYVTSDVTDFTKNRINLSYTSSYNVDKFQILREGAVSGIFEVIGEVNATESSYLDLTSVNSASSYKYKVRTKDLCGNISKESTAQKTILLQSSVATNKTVNLTWTPYEGITYGTYIIYRKINTGPFEVLASIASTNLSFIDISANTSLNDYSYYVSVSVNSCPTTSLKIKQPNAKVSAASEIRSNYKIISEQIVPSFTLPSTNFNVEVKEETCTGKSNGEINITAVESYDYVATINGKSYNFINNSLAVPNLTPGSYAICITIPGKVFEQCYTVNVAKGKTITGKLRAATNKVSVEIVEGTAPYQIFVNGKEQFETELTTFSVDVKKGDLLEVKTAKSCEGIYSKGIGDLMGDITLYPNPTTDSFEIILPTSRKEVVIDLYTSASQLISKRTYPVVNERVQLNLGNKPSGVYIVKIYLDTPENLTIIKN